MPRSLPVLALLALAAAGCNPDGTPTPQSATSPLERIELPDGFRIDYFARDVPGARSLAAGPDGIVFVGTRAEGVVYALVDADGDGKAERVTTVARGLTQPNGVALREGALYVAEIDRVLRFDGLATRLADPPEPETVNDAFPSDRHHGWKFIRFSPDGEWLYVPVGAPCNVCDEGDPYSAILRMRPDGSGLEVFARGVRNTVGFDWHPETGELWFTDNGRDWMGDDLPPDELNRAARPGLHFGFPHCHGGVLPDPEFAAGRECDEFEPPVRRLGAHVAALGMRFYDGESFPDEYRGVVFIAEHGSWNRSSKVGYRVTTVRAESAGEPAYEAFAEGWLDGEEAWGRPVDVEVLADGSLLVSDDLAGAVYRITHDGARDRR
jgi:glucose/arabinose dehydrogenase